MKRALVTGGSSPIGAAIAETLAAEGLHVIVQGRSRPEAAEAVCERIRAAGGGAESLTLDLSDEASFGRLAEIAEADPIQVFVHCAASRRDMPFAAMAIEDWREVIDAGLTSFFVALRPLIMPMMRTRWGRIVALSSLSGVVGNRGQSNYAAAKGGLHAAVKSLAREYGSRGVTANVIAPGLIDTPETLALANYDALARLSPIGRAGTPQEVADLVAFVASEKAGYLSGQIIRLDGGST